MNMKKLALVFISTILLFFVYSIFFYHNIPQEIIGEYHLIDGQINVETLSKSTVSLKIDKEGEISGTSAVNLYGGTISIKNETITFSDIFHTEMASMDPDINNLEIQYYDLLSQVNRLNIDHNQLILLKDTSPILIFEKD